MYQMNPGIKSRVKGHKKREDHKKTFMYNYKHVLILMALLTVLNNIKEEPWP